MKKRILLFIVAISLSMATFAQQTTSKKLSYAQQTLRDNISSYIKSEEMCKLNVSEDHFSLSTEMFLTVSSDFTSIFYKVMDVIDDAFNEILNI